MDAPPIAQYGMLRCFGDRNIGKVLEWLNDCGRNEVGDNLRLFFTTTTGPHGSETFYLNGYERLHFHYEITYGSTGIPGFTAPPPTGRMDVLLGIFIDRSDKCKPFLEICDQSGQWHSCWEYMYPLPSSLAKSNQRSQEPPAATYGVSL
ncbi:MAG: hypothetical protein LBI39_02675 [Puniceicoccales bacterium]|nr:hypothetical protein [Puniceicoccales bacterium]